MTHRSLGPALMLCTTLAACSGSGVSTPAPQSRSAQEATGSAAPVNPGPDQILLAVVGGGAVTRESVTRPPERGDALLFQADGRFLRETPQSITAGEGAAFELDVANPPPLAQRGWTLFGGPSACPSFHGPSPFAVQLLSVARASSREITLSNEKWLYDANGTLIFGNLGGGLTAGVFAGNATIPDSIPVESVTVLTTTASPISKGSTCWVALGKAPPFGFPP